MWSTTTPSTTFGKSTVLTQTTVTPSTEAPSQMSSVWSEPISFVVTNLRPYTTYLFEVSAVTTEAGYIDSAIVRTPESGALNTYGFKMAIKFSDLCEKLQNINFIFCCKIFLSYLVFICIVLLYFHDYLILPDGKI